MVDREVEVFSLNFHTDVRIESNICCLMNGAFECYCFCMVLSGSVCFLK